MLKKYNIIFYPAVALLMLLTACSPADQDNAALKEEAQRTTDVPDFAAYTDVKQKKSAFFEYLQPAYDQVSHEIIAIREDLLKWQTETETLATDDQTKLDALSDLYKVSGDNNQQIISQLLVQVDLLPEALVMSQAANETGWGTSRFAQQGYNFFGQWCFYKGCGFVPKDRNDGAAHEVAKFDSLVASVRSYHRNINRNERYAALRALRLQQRQANEVVNPCLLATGLVGYSERKEAYVEELQNMMRFNQQFWRDNDKIDYKNCLIEI